MFTFRCWTLILTGSILLSLPLFGESQAYAQAFPIFNDGFEQGDPCRWSGTSVSLDCPPVFPGITLAVATDEDEVTLGWLPATDDRTPTESLHYRVHLSTAPDFAPTAETLAATVTSP